MTTATSPFINVKFLACILFYINLLFTPKKKKKGLYKNKKVIANQNYGREKSMNKCY